MFEKEEAENKTCNQKWKKLIIIGKVICEISIFECSRQKHIYDDDDDENELGRAEKKRNEKFK